MDKLEATSVTPAPLATVAADAAAAIAPCGSADPTNVINENKLLMQIMARDFSNIRRAPGEYFSITDAICAFTDCQPNSARNKWCQVRNKIWPHLSAENFPVKFFQFPYKTSWADRDMTTSAREVKGGENRGVPCVRFKDLLTLLCHFDHPRCKALRQELANLATRASTGDEALEQALPVRRQEMPQELRDAMRAGLAGFEKGPADGALALQTVLITQLQKLVEAKELALKDKEAIITQQEARLALADLALKQQMTITRLQEENASKRRKLLIGAVPVMLSAEEEEDDVPENELRPAGSNCKGDPRWSRMMTEHARTFSEKLARSLTLHAKHVREQYLDEAMPTGNEKVVIDAGVTQNSNEEALAALRQAVVEVLRPADPAVLDRFQTINGTRVFSKVARIMCARLPRCNLNSTAIPLAHWFLYLVQKNAWGHGEDLEIESELEATMAGEVLGDDLYLYTLDEPHGLVRAGTPEFELRTKKLELARGGNSEAQEFFEARGLPANATMKREMAQVPESRPLKQVIDELKTEASKLADQSKYALVEGKSVPGRLAMVDWDMLLQESRVPRVCLPPGNIGAELDGYVRANGAVLLTSMPRHCKVKAPLPQVLWKRYTKSVQDLLLEAKTVEEFEQALAVFREKASKKYLESSVELAAHELRRAILLRGGLLPSWDEREARLRTFMAINLLQDYRVVAEL